MNIVLVDDNRIYLENKLGMIIRGMAYPDSGITKMHGEITYEQVKEILTQLDVAYCRTLGGDNEKFMLPTDWHAWMPTAHHINPHLLKFIENFNSLDPDGARGANRFPRLFYLWGHSFEFERNNNWELLDTIWSRRRVVCDQHGNLRVRKRIPLAYIQRRCKNHS